jgi:hypothetical protein
MHRKIVPLVKMTNYQVTQLATIKFILTLIINQYSILHSDREVKNLDFQYKGNNMDDFKY